MHTRCFDGILFKSDNWAKLIPSVVVARGCVVDKVGEVVDVPFGELRTLNAKKSKVLISSL